MALSIAFYFVLHVFGHDAINRYNPIQKNAEVKFNQGNDRYLPFSGGYQLSSPWPHVGGLLNSKSRQSLHLGPQFYPHFWQYSTKDVVESCSAIGSDGTIYVGSGYYIVFALSTSGSLKWNYSTGGDLASPAIGSDGTIYVGSGDYKMYAPVLLGLFEVVLLHWKFCVFVTCYGTNIAMVRLSR